MTFDPLTASIAGNFVTLACLSWALISRGNLVDRCRSRKQEADNHKFANSLLRVERDMLQERVDTFEAKAAATSARCKAASAKGHEVQSAKAEQRRRDASARTLGEAKQALTRMRSRAQVVAPVKAKRTRAKNSGGGSASKARG